MDISLLARIDALSNMHRAVDRCGAPKALGMLFAGLALRVMPGAPGMAPPLQGLSEEWSRNVRAGAMALIMLRAGLGINLRTLARFGWSFVAMSTLPALCESLLCAPVAMALFKMPFLLAWSMSAMFVPVLDSASLRLLTRFPPCCPAGSRQSARP